MLKIKKVFNILFSLISQFYYQYKTPNVETLIDKYVVINKQEQPKNRVLYIALKYDYGDRSRGMSYEEYNFFHVLKNMQDIEVIRYDFYSIASRYGKKIANRMLSEVVFLERVDAVLCLLYKDYFDHEMISDMSKNLPIETILWVFDDDKRFEETVFLSRCFNKTVTTIKKRLAQRVSRGENCVLAQFAANHYLYRNYNLKKKYDVVFVGQNFGNREMYIKFLRDNQVNVHAFGMGWPDGRLTQSEMIRVFNESKIILNFSSSYNNPELKYVKGRMFEIPACGSMLLTENCEDLDNFFNVGEHIDMFSTREELLEKVQFYLENENERVRVSEAGEKHVVENFTVEKYLLEILL